MTLVILGAGMAGLGAAHRFREAGREAVIYDKKPYAGGHTISFVHGDFIFDEGPHVSFTRDERIQELFAESVGGRFEVLQTQVDNYWRGHWIKHPAQCNLHGLPTDLVVDVIRDFVAVQGSADVTGNDATNYEEWLIGTYGRTFAETFPMVYGKKYHTCDAREMTTDWLGPRLYRPALEEVLRGALEAQTPDVHYVDHFRYPTEGGFVSFLHSFLEASTIHLDHEATEIDPAERTVTFRGGHQVSYNHLVSSVPLPELIPRIVGAPDDVREAAAKLACTTCILVNIGVDREAITDSHWTYFYDPDIVFTRLSAPHRMSPRTVPEGASSVQAEIYYSAKYRPLDRDPDDFIQPTLRDLRRVGLLREDDRILHQSAHLIPYANIIFDHDRPAALDLIFGYLDDIGIQTCGRYGRWGYHWTDESFVSGEEAAQAAIDRG